MDRSEDMADAEALRAALLEVLVSVGAELVKTQEGREQVAGQYWLAAGSAHPAVAAVYREAAKRVAWDEG